MTHNKNDMETLCRRNREITAELLRKLILSNLTEEIKEEIEQWLADNRSPDAVTTTLDVVCYEMNVEEEAFSSGLLECHLELKIVGYIE